MSEGRPLSRFYFQKLAYPETRPVSPLGWAGDSLRGCVHNNYPGGAFE
jgi:hypothetical protein